MMKYVRGRGTKFTGEKEKPDPSDDICIVLRCLLEFIQQLNFPRMHHQIMLKPVESGEGTEKFNFIQSCLPLNFSSDSNITSKELSMDSSASSGGFLNIHNETESLSDLIF